MWENKKPSYADQIRVNRGLYYHHGIYESNDVVYQFASPEGSEISQDTARVITTSLDKFLRGGVLEVRVYSVDELLKRKPQDEIIKYAKEHLGEGGYNLITNNCEHFSNRCAFGEGSSEQVDDVLNVLKGLFR